MAYRAVNEAFRLAREQNGLLRQVMQERRARAAEAARESAPDRDGHPDARGDGEAQPSS